MLTAATPEQLLSTIVSRCEVLRLRSSKVEDVQAMLKSRGVETGRADLLAHISGGRPGYANRLITDESLLRTRSERLNDLQSLLKSTRVQKFSYADKLSKDKNTMRQALLFWLSFWRDVLLKASKAASPITNVDCTDEIDALAGKLNLASARKVVAELELAVRRMENNVNPRLLAEVLLLDWPKV